MLSRNFRLQKVGNLTWLQKNYNFSDIAFYVDEIVVLNVERGVRDLESFAETLKIFSKGCFVPIAAGGGVRCMGDADRLLQSGADKLVLNTPLLTNQEFIEKIVSNFGLQCVVGSVDLKRNQEGKLEIFFDNGSTRHEVSPGKVLTRLSNNLIGELYLNSIDHDGTGRGFDFELLKILPEDWKPPVILAGGVGNWSHLWDGLNNSGVDAVATAHLFNFVGDGLREARHNLINRGANLAQWPELKRVQAVVPEKE